MKISRFSVLIAVVFIGLFSVLGILIWIAENHGLDSPTPNLIGGFTIGSRGPFSLTFPVEMDQANVEASISTNPPSSGWFVWQENKMFYFPKQPFLPGTKVSLQLAAGARSSRGEVYPLLKKWDYTIREDRLLFLGAPNSSPEIWKFEISSQQKTQITSTKGKINQFASSFTGDELLYSVNNGEGGADLWLLSLPEGHSEKILSCGADRCVQPTWSSIQRVAAYQRWRAKSIQPATYNPPQVWIVDLDTRETEELFPGVTLSVGDMTWSPDGKRLAVFDQAAQGIRLIDFSTGKEHFIPAVEGGFGNWNDDGTRLLFTRLLSPNSSAEVSIYELDAQDYRVIPLLTQDMGLVEFGAPSRSPDGTLIAVGLRVSGMGSTRQIWLINLKTQEKRVLTNQPAYSHANLNWNISGDRLAVQRLNLSGSRNSPQIIVFEMATGQLSVVEDNGAFPVWIP